MKKNRIFGLASAIALLAAGACSNDMIDPNKNSGGLLNTGDGSGGVYMTVDFQMPSGSLGTRSETKDPDPNGSSTSSDGTEIGTDAENYVSSALIVIASTESKTVGTTTIDEYGFIVAGEVPGNRIATFTSTENNESKKQYRAIAQLQKENLNDIYGLYEKKDDQGNTVKDENGDTVYELPEMYVFVFCNPTKDLLDVFNGENTAFGSSSWLDETCEVIQSVDQTQNKNVGIWSANSFLMNNVKLTKRELPKNLLDWEYYSSATSPFQLSGKNDIEGVKNPVDNSRDNELRPDRGSVLVERSVARFDFKDGSPKDNRYVVLLNTKENGDFDEAQPVVDVQIQKMCLVNMSNKFYYLPRVSNDGLPNGADFKYCGPELPWVRNGSNYSGGNYVVGPYADIFGGDAVMTDFTDYMNFPFFENNGSFNSDVMSNTRWDVVKVEDVLKNGHGDNYTGAGHAAGDYKVWRYVTENVIPVNKEKQMNGVSTGVVFKGKLLGNAKVGDDETTYHEEAWEAGNLQNLANCLNGKPFKYNGVEGKTLQGNSHDDPILYYLNGKLYFGWRHLRQAAIQASITINANGQMEINVSNTLYKAVFGDGPIPTYNTSDDAGETVVNHMVYIDSDGKALPVNDPRWDAIKDKVAGYTTPLKKDELENITDEDLLGYLQSPNFAWSQWALNDKELGDASTGAAASAKLAAMREAVTGANIVIYQSSDDKDYGPGYYCYYYYWNRHNDNGMNGSMGPMEFAVVRNNVYKLSIDKIARLGHPRIPENDPDNPTPDTPDESDEIYLAVRVQIAPWVVRLNSIQF